MSKKTICLLVFIISTALTACAGWVERHDALIPSTLPVVSKTYKSNQQVVQYSDGTSVTNKAVSVAEAWAEDHVTKTITYTFDDGNINTEVLVVPGVTSIVYAVDSETVFTRFGDGTTSITTNKEKASLK